MHSKINNIYICVLPATNTRLRERKCDGWNERMNITYIYIVFTGSKIL